MGSMKYEILATKRSSRYYGAVVRWTDSKGKTLECEVEIPYHADEEEMARVIEANRPEKIEDSESEEDTHFYTQEEWLAIEAQKLEKSSEDKLIEDNDITGE